MSDHGTHHTLTMSPHSRVKRQKTGHSVHKRLEEVMAMNREERVETRLPEAIKLAFRRHMPHWSPLRLSTGNVVNPSA